MRLLYIFPHPDDESFGPGPAMARQRRQGHEVFLLTLTRGEATKKREVLGLSKQEMGVIRARETLRAAGALGLSGAEVLNLPDGGLPEMDPRAIEDIVRERILALRPNIVVTYELHGISGFPDHIAIHPVVKRVFCELREKVEAGFLRRLAFYCMFDDQNPSSQIDLHISDPELVDVAVPLEDEDLERGRAALACYETYQDVIAEHDPLARQGRTAHFQIFGEDHKPRLGDLGEGL